LLRLADWILGENKVSFLALAGSAGKGGRH
jgi:hypothetical protein